MSDYGWQVQAARLAQLLDALNGVELTPAELRTLEWITGWEPELVENLATVFTKARNAGPERRCTSWTR